jgi:hypothetical protein
MQALRFEEAHFWGKNEPGGVGNVFERVKNYKRFGKT